MHTFCRQWLAGQRCRYWRVGAPGQISVRTPFVRRRKLLCLLFPVVGVKLQLSTIFMVIRTMCRSCLQVSHDAIQCRRLLQDRQQSSGPPLSRKAILDVLCYQGDLVYGRPSVSKVRLLLKEQWVDEWFDTSVDESLEYIWRGHTRKILGSSCGSPSGSSGFGIATLVLFSRSLEFCVDACRKRGNRTTMIWESVRRGV